MAPPEKQQRQQADDGDSQPDQTPYKEAESPDGSRQRCNFSPAFYDDLPKVWLTIRALRELDRRNQVHAPSEPAPQVVKRHRRAKIAALEGFGASPVALSASDGGPDLSNLRGCPEPIGFDDSETIESTEDTMAKNKRCTAYDANFDQYLIANSIYPPEHEFADGRQPPEPANWDEIQQALKDAAAGASLLSSDLSRSAFKDFRHKRGTSSEAAVMGDLVPVLAGTTNIPNGRQISYVNLASITKHTTAIPAPDFFDGARYSDLDQKVRDDLYNIVIPSPRVEVPIAPNFFLEVKGALGTIKVAESQVVLVGAHGAVIMHALQNYLQTEPVYDGNAHAFTSTLVGGMLTLYAHYITAPTTPGQSPDYHIIQINAYALHGNYETWLAGIAAFRSLRMLAERYRNDSIKTANAISRQTAGNDDAMNPEASTTGFVTRLASSVALVVSREHPPKRPRSPSSPSSAQPAKRRM